MRKITLTLTVALVLGAAMLWIPRGKILSPSLVSAQIYNPSGTACDPTAQTCFIARDTMCGGNASSGTIGDMGWGLTASTTTVKLASTWPLCALSVTTGGTTGNTGFVSLGSGVGIFGTMGSHASWHVRQIFTHTRTTAETFRCGFADPATYTNTTPGWWMGVRFRAGTDTNWQFVVNSAGTDTLTDSTIAEDDGVLHSIQMDSTVAGTVVFTLYGATGNVLKTSTVSSGVPTSAMLWECGSINSQTAAGPVLVAGPFVYWVNGLTLP